MEELDLRIYLKVLLKYKVWIILFVSATLIVSVIFNYGIKKPPAPMYHVEGSIDASAVVFDDKTVPSVMLDDATVQRITDKSLSDLKLKKADYNVKLDFTKPNTILASADSYKVDKLDVLVNKIITACLAQIKANNKLAEPAKPEWVDKTVKMLNDSYKEKVLDSKGKVSYPKMEAEVKIVNAELAELQENITTYGNNLETLGFNIKKTGYFIEKYKTLLQTLEGKDREDLGKKILELEIQLVSDTFYYNYYSENIPVFKATVIQIEYFNKVFSWFSQLNVKKQQIALFDSTAKNNPAVVTSITPQDIRPRSIIVSIILAFVLICCAVMAWEYYNGKNQDKNEIVKPEDKISI